MTGPTKPISDQVDITSGEAQKDSLQNAEIVADDKTSGPNSGLLSVPFANPAGQKPSPCVHPSDPDSRSAFSASHEQSSEAACLPDNRSVGRASSVALPTPANGAAVSHVTRFSKYSAVFLWTIEDFKIHRTRIRTKELPRNQKQYLESPFIETRKLPGNWWLRLHPCYHSGILPIPRKNRMGVAIFLMAKPTANCNVNYTIQIIGDVGNVVAEVSTGTTFQLFSAGGLRSKGFDSFLPPDEELIERCTGHDGSLKVKLKVDIVQDGPGAWCGNTLLNDVSQYVSQAQPSMYDVALHVNDKKIVASRFMLCARSPVFRKILQTHDCQKPLIITGKTDNTMRHLVNFIHTDACELLSTNSPGSVVDESEVRALLSAATEYQVEVLSKRCEDLLSETIQPKSVSSPTARKLSATADGDCALVQMKTQEVVFIPPSPSGIEPERAAMNSTPPLTLGHGGDSPSNGVNRW